MTRHVAIASLVTAGLCVGLSSPLLAQGRDRVLDAAAIYGD